MINVILHQDNYNNRYTVLFKQIINSLVIRGVIFNHVKSIHRSLITRVDDCDKIYKWSVLYSSFNKLVLWGYLKELKYRLENEDIDHTLLELFNRHNNNNNNNQRDRSEEMIQFIKSKRDSYKGDRIDHRIIGLARIACVRGHLDIIKYLDDHHQSDMGAFNIEDMSCALENGHLDIARYLYDNRRHKEGYDIHAIEEASKRGYLEILELLLKEWNCNDCNLSLEPMNNATTLDTLKLLHRYSFKCGSFDAASRIGSLEMIEFIHQHCPEVVISPYHLGQVSKHGRMDIMKYLVEIVAVRIDLWSLDMVAGYKQLEILKYLSDHSQAVKCSNRAMDSQSIPILEYLHQYHQLDYSVDCAMSAARTSNLDIIIFLHNNGVSLVDEEIMNEAARGGHLDIVKYLHHNIPSIKCTIKAMNIAAAWGNIEIVKFLHYNRSEGCDEEAMSFAIRSNHMDIVQFLHYNRSEGYHAHSINNVSMEMIEFLRVNRSEGFTQTLLKPQFIKNGNLEMIKYIHHHYPHIVFKPTNSSDEMIDIAKCNDIEMIKFLHFNRSDVTTTASSWKYCSNEILSFLLEHRMNDKSIAGKSIDIYHYIEQSKKDITLERLNIMNMAYKDKKESKEHRGRTQHSLEVAKYNYLFVDRLLIDVKSTIIIACLNGNISMIQFILDQYPSPNPIEYYHLEKAVKQGHLNTVKYLIQHASFTPQQLNHAFKHVDGERHSFLSDYVLSQQ